MSDIHSCSYYCTRPACVLQQRDELRGKLEQAAPPQITHAEGCWSWGPQHYECACAEVAKLKGWGNGL
jgi:hypothetical protein